MSANTEETTLDNVTSGLRSLNERWLTEAKKAGGVSLDAYESTFRSIADYTDKLGAASTIEPVSALAHAQAQLTRELTGAYTTAARALLV